MSRRAALAALATGLLLALLLGGLALSRAAANPAAQALRLDSPQIGGHTYSIWLLPCSAFTPGLIVAGRDLWTFSSYPPPGPKLALAPPCP